MSTLELRAIGKSYGRSAVLHDISLGTEDGEFLAMVGPSGCGKSTLLRIIAGLETQDRGTVRIGGVPADGAPARQRNVAMVFQSYALYPHMTVAGNIALPLLMRDLTRLQRLPGMRRIDPRIRDRRQAITVSVAETARLLQIESLLDRKPAQLSGGQRQRVALARALVRAPRLFLLDEPLSNLDAGLRAEMRNEIVRLQRRLGVTTVLVTHDQIEAMTMADRIAVMFDGRIAQLGTPAEIYNCPASLDVARFIGSPKINVVAASQDEQHRLKLGGRTLPATVPPAAARDGMHVAIRPEHISLHAPQRDFMLAGTIQHVEYLGSESLAYLRLPGLPDDIAIRLDASGAGRAVRGEAAAISFAPEHVQVFAADGKRLGTCRPALAVARNASA
jgi:multiple sugar transport system ATP-binding protein